MPPRDLAMAGTVVVLWGLNFLAMKFGLRDFTPFQLGAARFFFALFPLVLFVRPPRVALRWIAAYGLLQGVGQFGFLFVALKVGMTAALASVLLQTQVFFTAAFGVLLLGERVGRPLKLGMLIAAGGLACFAIGVAGESGTRAVTAAGLVLNLCAASMWAGSNIVVRRMQAAGLRYDALGLVVWSGAVSFAAFVAMSWAFDDPALRWRWIDATWLSWLSIAYLGWVATVVGYVLWTSLLKRHPAGRVAPFSLGIPIVGLLGGLWVLGERVSAWQWAGAVLVLAALVAVVGGPALAARAAAR